jgi:hypothetical protein
MKTVRRWICCLLAFVSFTLPFAGFGDPRTGKPSSPVALWPGEENANDVVGGNNGVWQGTASYGKGEVGRAFVFNGVNNGILIADNPRLHIFESAITIETWFKVNSVSANYDWAFLVAKGSYSWRVEIHTTTGHAAFSITGLSPMDMEGNKDVLDGEWHHLAAVYDGNKKLLYVDGALDASNSVTGAIPQDSSDLQFGDDTSADVNSNGHFDGSLDEVSLYNQALSASEIQESYRAGRRGKRPLVPTARAIRTEPTNHRVIPDMVSWWRAEGDATDSVGNNNGVITGAVSFTTGQVGNAFLFTDTNEDIRIPASPSLDLGAASGFTLEAWINPTDVSTRHPIFEWNAGDGVTYWGVHFYIDPVIFGGTAPGSLYANIQGEGDVWHQMWSSGNVAVSNVFQHVALTYDKASGLATIYRNGVQVAQQNFGSFTPKTSGLDLHIGRRPTDPGGERYTFSGKIDEPAIFNRALSAEEVKEIYIGGAHGKHFKPKPHAVIAEAAIHVVTVENTDTARASLTSNIVSWWHAEGDATDAVGNNNGIITGAVSFAAGKVGRAFLFTDANEDIRIPANPTLDVGASDGFTLEAWINPTDVSARHPIFEWNAGDGMRYWGIGLYIDPVTAGNGYAPGSLYANIQGIGDTWHQIWSPGDVLVSNVFQHVAVTYDKESGLTTLYCNGVQVAQRNFGSFTPKTTGLDLHIGRRPTDPGRERYTFAGMIDEPAVHNRALSASEIADIYNAGVAGKHLPPSAPLTIVTQSGDQTLQEKSMPESSVNAAPGLNYSHNAGGLTLSWPVWAADFTLQSATSLTPRVTWTNVPVTLQTNGDTIEVTVPPPDEQAFFRLYHP